MNEQDKKLNEIRALLEAATPGKWTWEGDILITSAPEYLVLKPFYEEDTDSVSTCVMPHDAALIAAAPEALTYTLDIIARQDAELKKHAYRHKKSIDCWMKDYNDLQADRDRLAAECKAKDARIEALERFKAYWDSVYGQGLEVANWHMNGTTEPFDNFYNSACDYARFREGGGE